MDLLHLTNGDNAARVIRSLGIGGEVMPWRDVLHEGPVTSDDEQTLRQQRAAFLADYMAAYGDADSADEAMILADMEKRDNRLRAVLKGTAPVTEIVLWFEHDLYDQLQILQILDRLAPVLVTQDGSIKITLVEIDSVPGIMPFGGLAHVPPEGMFDLFEERRPLGADEGKIGSQAWQAFTAADPTALTALLSQDLRCLPYLKGALQRWCREFPHVRTGLTGLQQRLSGILQDEGALTFGRLFKRLQERDPAPYVGDIMAWGELRHMADLSLPLISIAVQDDGRHLITLTDDGRAALMGKRDALENNPDYRRWRGGVCLTPDNLWRFDPVSVSFVKD